MIHEAASWLLFFLEQSTKFKIHTNSAFHGLFFMLVILIMFRISTYGYAGVGFMIMMTIGIAINIVKPEQRAERIRHLTFAGRKYVYLDCLHNIDFEIQFYFTVLWKSLQ